MFDIESLRQYRVAGYALFDFAATFVGIIIAYPLLRVLTKKCGFTVPLLGWLFFSMPLGILAHIAVGSITPMTEAFLRVDGGYEVKAVVIVCCVLGAATVRRVKKR